MARFIFGIGAVTNLNDQYPWGLWIGIDVAAGEGVLRIRELQRPGKRRMAAADYLNAGPVAAFLESPEQDAGS